MKAGHVAIVVGIPILSLAVGFGLGIWLHPFVMPDEQDGPQSESKQSLLADLRGLDQALERTSSTHAEKKPSLENDLTALQASLGKIVARVEKDNSEQARGSVDWPALLSAIAWPIVVGACLLIILFGRRVPMRLGQIFRPFRSVKLFGAEFVLAEGVGPDAEQTINTYRSQLKREYDVRIAQHALRAKLQGVLKSNALAKAMRAQNLRCTIHVPDALFRESLYQLMDYYPKGGGHGRAWSERYGIIGRAWRLNEPQMKGNVPTDQKRLISDWGLTLEEAEGDMRKSFFCAILKNKEQTPVGIFYMDSVAEDAFGDPSKKDELQEAILKECEQRGVTEALSKISSELQSRGPRIQIYA